MMRRTTARPMPAPWVRVVKKSSKMRALASSGTPGPWSSTREDRRRRSSQRARARCTVDARGARLDGVAHEVPEHLPHLRAVAPGERLARRALVAHRRRPMPRAAFDAERDDLARERRHVGRLGARRRAAWRGRPCRPRGRSAAAPRAARCRRGAGPRPRAPATRGASRSSPVIDPSGLRISCASPAAMRPRTARRSASWARARGRLRARRRSGAGARRGSPRGARRPTTPSALSEQRVDELRGVDARSSRGLVGRRLRPSRSGSATQSERVDADAERRRERAPRRPTRIAPTRQVSA